jgi:hypothetical protein
MLCHEALVLQWYEILLLATSNDLKQIRVREKFEYTESKIFFFLL